MKLGFYEFQKHKTDEYKKYVSNLRIKRSSQLESVTLFFMKLLVQIAMIVFA